MSTPVGMVLGKCWHECSCDQGNRCDEDFFHVTANLISYPLKTGNRLEGSRIELDALAASIC